MDAFDSDSGGAAVEAAAAALARRAAAVPGRVAVPEVHMRRAEQREAARATGE